MTYSHPNLPSRSDAIPPLATNRVDPLWTSLHGLSSSTKELVNAGLGLVILGADDWLQQFRAVEGLEP